MIQTRKNVNRIFPCRRCRSFIIIMVMVVDFEKNKKKTKQIAIVFRSTVKCLPNFDKRIEI